MIRNRFLILFLLTSVFAAAQDDFYKVLDRASATTAPEGLYILMHFQQANPKFAPVYYHMGQISWQLAADQHPLREYNDLQQCLYRTRVFYGNCLHYAQGQKIVPQAYHGVTFKSKKPAFEDLKPILDSRLVEVTDAETKARNLYDAYCRLAERYNRCRQLFTTFSSTYLGEKSAHLYLKDADRELLQLLALQADSIPGDIQALQQALRERPVADYKPYFHFQPINLYGLDGLTGVNLLQDDVPLWDYATWARRFLQQQDGLYSEYYRAVNTEHASLHRTMARLETAGYQEVKPNELLLNRIDRMDFASPMRDWIELDQKAALTLMAPYDSLLHQQPDVPDDDYRDKVLHYIYDQYNHLRTVRQLRERLLTVDSLVLQAKYGALLGAWGDTTAQRIQDDMQSSLLRSEKAYRECCTLAYQGISPAFKPFTRYENELTGEVLTADSLHYMFEGELIAILPVGHNFLAVEHNKRAVLTDENGQSIAIERYPLSGAIRAAVKLSGNTIALIGEEEILFIDNRGKVK